MGRKKLKLLMNQFAFFKRIVIVIIIFSNSANPLNHFFNKIFDVVIELG